MIAWGREPDVLLRLAAGEAIGTTLLADTPKLAARKLWMIDHLQLRGAVVIDDGAVAKLRDGGKSLLPIGVVEVERRLPSRRRDRGAQRLEAPRSRAAWPTTRASKAGSSRAGLRARSSVRSATPTSPN